jgi:hypothetical protein
MAKSYMVGTLDDYPLLKVTLNGIVYFVDERDKKVFLDEKGLPQVKDEDVIKSVLATLES